jgi:DNA mismatch repair protein MutS
MDIERIFRLISLKRCELIKFASFIYSIKGCYKLLKKINKNSILKTLFLNETVLNDIEEINNYLENIIDVDILKKYNMSNIKENFFKNNDNELLDIENIINTNKQNIENIIDALTSTNETKDWIKLLQTEKEGYYLFTSKTRYDKLVKDNNTFKFTTIKLSNGIKFYNDDIKKYSNNILTGTDLLTDKLKIKYLNFIEDFANNYKNKINNIINLLADFDITYSNAITSIMYNFVKPNINKDNKLVGKGVRHLLIELYNQEEVYTANDIVLNKDNLGYLILAPNSCGKSSYLRSIGIALVLAQMGSYVPAKEFNYNPYSKILCKISSIDNIYESKSKFIQDIIHMNMFIENADDKTLVLVDEFLNSTEEFSAAALTATSIDALINKNSNFVYTSHINSIIDLLKENKKVKFKHFNYNIIDNTKIIFDRILKDGPPQHFLYGIEISQHIINNKLFLSNAYEYRNKLMHKNNNLLNTKLSYYNKNKVIDKCEICKSDIELETHHKVEQHCANEFGIIITENSIFHKNNKHNLQILCKNCHKKIHK